MVFWIGTKCEFPEVYAIFFSCVHLRGELLALQKSHLACLGLPSVLYRSELTLGFSRFSFPISLYIYVPRMVIVFASGYSMPWIRIQFKSVLLNGNHTTHFILRLPHLQHSQHRPKRVFQIPQAVAAVITIQETVTVHQIPLPIAEVDSVNLSSVYGL